jgi:hypothetical protein
MISAYRLWKAGILLISGLTRIQKAMVIIVVTAVAGMTLWMGLDIIVWRKNNNNLHSFLIQLLILNLSEVQLLDVKK